MVAIKTCEDLVHVLLVSESRRDFEAMVQFLDIKVPLRVRNVTLATQQDVMELISTNELDWSALKRMVRLSGLGVFVGCEDSLSRFKCREEVVMVCKEISSTSQYVRHAFQVVNGPTYVVTLEKTDNTLRTAWDLVISLLSRMDGVGGLVLVEYEAVHHLVDLTYREFDMAWELYMGLGNKCVYLDEAVKSGSVFVMSGKEYLKALSRKTQEIMAIVDVC